jgi:hypothetical protein
MVTTRGQHAASENGEARHVIDRPKSKKKNGTKQNAGKKDKQEQEKVEVGTKRDAGEADEQEDVAKGENGEHPPAKKTKVQDDVEVGDTDRHPAEHMYQSGESSSRQLIVSASEKSTQRHKQRIKALSSVDMFTSSIDLASSSRRRTPSTTSSGSTSSSSHVHQSLASSQSLAAAEPV